MKRSLTYVDDGSFQNCSQQLVVSHPVSKRVCRNLSDEFCSETAASSEPNLDLWVLRTLGLKDRDTIDVTSSSSSGAILRGLKFDCPNSSSTCSPPPAPVRSYRQRSTAEYSCCTAGCPDTDPGVDTASGCRRSPDQHHDLPATVLARQYDASGAVIGSYDLTTTFQSPTTPEEKAFSLQSPDSAEICSITTFSQSHNSLFWSPPTPRSSCTPSKLDTTLLGPSGQRLPYSPITSRIGNQLQATDQDLSRKTPCGGPASAQMPRSQTDLAFSMSLSPSSSVKTHSFHQGQAFVRKDTEGRWNFTWVPRQGL